MKNEELKNTLQMFHHFFRYVEKHYGKDSYQMWLLLSYYKEFIDEVAKQFGDDEKDVKVVDDFIDELMEL